MKKYRFIILLTISFLWIVSCKKEQDQPISPSVGKYETGEFIINEGNFGKGNGSISYLNTEKQEVIPNIFQLENDRNLGDVVQSMQIIDDKAYIAVNNSNKIEIVDSRSFKELGVLENMPLVRYVVRTGQATACASLWGNSGQVVYFNTNNYEVIKSIPVGNGPEGMIHLYSKLFVANSGGLDVDHTVSVISDDAKDGIVNIEVGYSPKQFVFDTYGMLWVLCSGTGSWSSVGVKPSKLVQINPINLEVVQEVNLFEDLQIGSMGIDPTGTVIVVGGGYGVNGLYKVFVKHPEPPAEAFISGDFYGFSIDDANGDIYIADAGDYMNVGSIHHYTFQGKKLNDLVAGIIPNGVYFRLPVAIE